MASKAALSPQKPYVLGALVLVLVGIVAGQLLEMADVGYTPVADVSTFAVLYVLAQGVERIVEWVILGIGLANEGFAESKKRTALATLATANSTLNGNPVTNDFDVTDANAKTKAEKAKDDLATARKDLTFFSQGLAFALSYAAVSYFEFGIFATIGVTGMEPGVDRALTAIAVAGGSKGLHDLISKVQKSKEKDETPPTAPGSTTPPAG